MNVSVKWVTQIIDNKMIPFNKSQLTILNMSMYHLDMRLIYHILSSKYKKCWDIDILDLFQSYIRLIYHKRKHLFFDFFFF